MATNNASNDGKLYSAGNGYILIAQNSGQATPATITAGSNVTVTNGANSITIASSAGGYTVVNQNSGSATLANGNIYISNNGASLITYTLPATAAVGDRYEIIGGSSGGWTVAQNASQQIHSNSSATTSGTGGNISSVNQYNSVVIYCVATNNTFNAMVDGAPTFT